ncbi:MAG: hypothetical protein R3F17_04985 [Planctomycetota bacterium]
MTGAHLKADCVTCHKPVENGRRLGPALPVDDLLSGPMRFDCARCHEDPHGGDFDGVGMPQEWQGRVGCARCHGTEDFRALPSGNFDHNVWTAFALNGAHTQTLCRDCHGVTENGKIVLAPFEVLAAGQARACECHDSPHRGCSTG